MTDLLEQTPWLIPIILVATGLAAGWIDAIVGGGGLLQLSMLLLMPGITPLQALAANKFGSISGTTVSSITYARKIRPEPRTIITMAIVAFCASLLGATVATILPGKVLLPLIIAALLVVLALVVFRPKLGSETEAAPPQRSWLSAIKAGFVGLAVGFYDGMLGPGTGTFLTMGLVLVLGYSFLRATANAKIVNWSTNLASLVVFIPIGAVRWDIVLWVAAGNMCGAFLGARMALKHGSGFIRLLLTIVGAMLLVMLSIDMVNSWNEA